MDVTVKYRKSRFLEVILIIMALLAFGLGGYEIDRGALSISGFNTNASTARTSNSVALITTRTSTSYVTTIQSATQTVSLTGSNRTFTETNTELVNETTTATSTVISETTVTIQNVTTYTVTTTVSDTNTTQTGEHRGP